MMGAQALSDEADTLLSIIADNDKYKKKIQEMKDLAQALTAEKDRLTAAQKAYNEQVKQVSDDRTAIEKAAAKAQADLKDAQDARDQLQAKLAQAAKETSAAQAKIDGVGASNAARSAALDKLTKDITAREAKVADREKAIEKREVEVERLSADMKSRLSRLKEAVG